MSLPILPGFRPVVGLPPGRRAGLLTPFSHRPLEKDQT